MAQETVTKMSKTEAAYQDRPKGNARCDGCTGVEGHIAPQGWCRIYKAK